MKYLQVYMILGMLVQKLIDNGIYEITEDEVMRFNFFFVIKASEKDKTFLRIDREDLIKFSEENKNYLLFKRDLNVLCIKKFIKNEAYNYFKDLYAQKFYSIFSEDDDAYVDGLLEEAIEYALA